MSAATSTAATKLTHAQLKERAKELDIPGRTQMRRAELEQAIAAALAGEPIPTPARKVKKPETLSGIYGGISENAEDVLDELDLILKATSHLLAGIRDPKAHEWLWLFDTREPKFGRIVEISKQRLIEYPIAERGPDLSIAHISLTDGCAAFELHDGRTVRLPAPELCDELDADRASQGLALLTYLAGDLSKWKLAPEELAALELFARRQEMARKATESELRELREASLIDEPKHKRVAKRTVARALYSEAVRGPSAALANRTHRKTSGQAVGEGGTTVRTVNISKQGAPVARYRREVNRRKRTYDNYAISNTRVDHHLPAVVLYVKLCALQSVGLCDIVEFEPEFEWEATGRTVRTDLLLRLARPEAMGDPDASVVVAVETDMGSAAARDPRPEDKKSHVLWFKFENYQALGRQLALPAGRELRMAFLTPPYAELFQGTAPADRGAHQRAVYERWHQRLARRKEQETFAFVPLAEPNESNLASALEKLCAKAYQDYDKARPARERATTSAKTG